MQNWLLERKLKKMGHKADPRPEFLHALEKQLKQQSGHRSWWIQGWKVAVGGVSALAMVSSATGVYAYNSDAVTPDHPLYGIRTAIEHVETTLATTPEQKARIAIKHLERRVKEQQVMQSKHKVMPTAALQRIETDLSKQIDENEVLATSTRQELDERIGTIKETHFSLIRDDESTSTNPEIEKLNKKIENLDEARKASIQEGEQKRETERHEETKLPTSRSESTSQE